MPHRILSCIRNQIYRSHTTVAADTYTLPPLRQAESPALSRSRHRFNNDMPRRGAIFGPSIATWVLSWRVARRLSHPDAHGHRGRSHERYGSEQGLSTA